MVSMSISHITSCICWAWALRVLLGQEQDESKQETFCRARNRPIATEWNDLFELLEVKIGQHLVMQCHYCKEVDNEEAKVWFKTTYFVNFTHTEMQIDMGNDRNSSRVFVNLDHSLHIQNVTYNDSGYYFCHNIDWTDSEKEFNFYVDVVEDNSTNIESGNLTQWHKYSHDFLMPINTLLASSNGADYFYLRETLKLTLEVITKWTDWGDCETCGRPQGEGIRIKVGPCAIKITRQNGTIIDSDLLAEERRLLQLDKISCKSLILKHLTPSFYNTTKVIPDFVLSEQCDGVCNPDAEGIYKGWKSTKKTGYKYRKTFVLTENSHLTLVCPESSLDNVVVWSKNAKVLPAGESVPPPSPNMEPKIAVDTFNTLYLHEVTKEEEGNYTCQVDGIRMQQVVIFVVSKSRLLTQALLRHMMYLGFILSLTISCYICGLIITYTRRDRFKTYRELKILQKNKTFLKENVFDDDETTEKRRKNESKKREAGKKESETEESAEPLKNDQRKKATESKTKTAHQVRSLLIQTFCGVRPKASEDLLKVKRNKLDKQEDCDKKKIDKKREKRTRNYRGEGRNEKDYQHLLSTDSSEEEIEFTTYS